MKIVEVVNAKLAEIFYRTPQVIYKNDKNWVAPFYKEIENVFSENKNHFYQSQYCKQWLLFINDAAIGRIAAFYNPQYKNKGDVFKVGGIGFFECINNLDAAQMLFKNAEAFLNSLNCDAVDGPINLGERDKFWGLLTEGFQRPLYGMNYHLPYYKNLFESCGYKSFYEQYCFEIEIKNWHSESLSKINQRILSTQKYTIKSFNKHDAQKFITDFVYIYNAAWQTHEGNKKINITSVQQMFKAMNFFIEEDFLVFAYYQNEPVAFFINLPDINFYFKNLNGKINWQKKIWLLIKKIFFTPPRLVGMIFGVVPSHQSKGIETLLIYEVMHKMQVSKFSIFEMQWIGSFNLKMISFVQRLNAKKSRTFITYRKILNPATPFHIHPNL